MKRISVLFLGLLFVLFVSCEKNTEGPSTYNINGKAQKGPFITGTTVTINELNSSLGQTGKSFTTTIQTDDGSFAMNNIELNGNLALLTANGFYFSENYGELSSATLSLQALSDLTDKSSVNINVLTHLAKGRIEKLVAGGKSFKEANAQAKTELLSFLGVNEKVDKDFDNMDISSSEDINAILLSFSIMLQRYTMIWNEKPSLTAELSQLLSNLSADFMPDGIISDSKLIDTLLFNISRLNLIDIRRNIEKRYSDLGQTVTIPNFEKYIGKFQEKYCKKLYSSFTYPVVASPDLEMSPDSKIQNILVQTDTQYQMKPYSIAAITPLYKTLKIRFAGKNYQLGPLAFGWDILNRSSDSFTLVSQRQNELMSMLITLEPQGSAIIEYYEDNSATPTFKKIITWQ